MKNLLFIISIPFFLVLTIPIHWEIALAGYILYFFYLIVRIGVFFNDRKLKRNSTKI